MAPAVAASAASVDLSEDGGKPVESASDTHEGCLVTLFQCQHVEAVSGNVVCGRGESRDDEQHQCDAEHTDGSCSGSHSRLVRSWNGQRQQDECHGHQNLHGKGPPSFGLDDVDKRAPERFDGPGQIEQACKQGHLSVRYAHLGKHHYGDVVYDEIRNALCKVQGRYPCPWRYVFCMVHDIGLFVC